MLYNGHLVITANQDSSLDLLHQWLLNDSDKTDIPGRRRRGKSPIACTATNRLA
ncbi:hypothetical protein AB0I84_15860 [Streptomyces spectabilis]|uniref:hypothetical protein n=1 Tax=Streptomyces spectabilis TaxID=68270 RepID=UPI0033DAE777